MAVRLRPMTEEDYLNSGGQVLRGVGKDYYQYLSDGLDSKVIFGDFSSRTSPEQTCLRDNVRGYIILYKPVLNYVLSRNGALLCKILGIPSNEASKLKKMEVVFSKPLGEYVSASEIDDPQDMLCGGEIFKKLIDEFDFEEATKEEFLSIIRKAVISSSISPDTDIGTIGKESGDVELLGGYYYTPNGDPARFLKNGKSLSDIQSFIEDKLFNGRDERLLYLLNSNKDKLYGMLFNYITVMPPGMRPDIQNRHDPFTKQYAAVISANDALKITNNGGYTVQEVIQRYTSLDKAVSQLVYKSDKRNQSQSSVIEKLASKKGFIRGKMSSKREDYSGRSVIVVNPELSIDECALPKEMIPKLFRYHHLKEIKGVGISKVLRDSDENNTESIKRLGILDRVPVALNRAPTLHRLSFLGYRPKISQSKAIEINPLATPGFNADFDGDTMAVHVPLSDKAILETENLILSTHNLFVPASGKCTLAPRQEMIYGLNVATRSRNRVDSSPIVAEYNSIEILWDAVCNHQVKVHERVTVKGKGSGFAGDFAFCRCLPNDMHSSIKPVTKSSIGWYVEELLTKGIDVFKTSINRMVILGFKMAQLYSPTISILQDIDDDFINNPFSEFHERMKEIIWLYENGFEEEKTFNSKFSEEFQRVEKKVKDRIPEGLGYDNGFLRMVESGARGTVDNLIQIYAYKGRISKSSNEAFNAVIENNFTTGLTPLEHFISAYGTRKGLIDKVNKTADTGYQMRLMEHTCVDGVITKEDCHTTNGLTISKNELRSFVHIETDDEEEKRKLVDDVFFDMIVGRYEAGTDVYIDKKRAREIVNTNSSVKIRSPLMCEEQYCSKCYGQDLSIRGDAAVGLPVGIMAAQSIGEPGTQLTMRTFQKGGVAGKGDVTSDFERIKAFTHMSSLREKFPTYDPIAWGVGKVIESPVGFNEKIIMIEGYSKSVRVSSDAEIKSEIKEVGEGLCVQQGDHDPKEVLTYKGLESAKRYLLFVLYHTYLGKADINLKHFEVLVSSMILHTVLTTDRPDLKIGQSYTTRELLKGDTSNTRVKSTLRGVKEIPLFKKNALSNIIMENIVAGLSKAVALGNDDDLSGVFQSIFLGLKPKLGTSYDNYMTDRLQYERCRLE